MIGWFKDYLRRRRQRKFLRQLLQQQHQYQLLRAKEDEAVMKALERL